MSYLTYNGKYLIWMDKNNRDIFHATSGMEKFQKPAFQCEKGTGPIPEGTYYLQLRFNPNYEAVVADPQTCALKPAKGIQTIPDSDPLKGTADCGPYWDNWGANRVRIDAADHQTRNACNPRRGGFYLHDSSKGFTHGCIEVEHRFFVKLYEHVQSHPKKHKMFLKVKYRLQTTRGKYSAIISSYFLKNSCAARFAPDILVSPGYQK